MATKINFHGRRICKWETTIGIIYTWSGQWVGHAYGHEKGTQKQIENSKPHEFLKNGGCLIMYCGSSDKVFWKKNGVAGDILKNENEIKTAEKINFSE